MSNVRKNDQKKSKVEFDNTYFKVHDDAIFLIENKFGAKGELQQTFETYINVMKEKVLNDVIDMGTNIRIANSIFPISREEYLVRRTYQKKAIGLCFDLLTKYQLIMNTLKVPDDKYTIETKHLVHEINCLKRWRKSDNKRYKNLG